MRCQSGERRPRSNPASLADAAGPAPPPGTHEHVIQGYSLLKGIGDGEPIASDRFLVGGHEWVLLFYPDGKRSNTEMMGAHGGRGHRGRVPAAVQQRAAQIAAQTF